MTWAGLSLAAAAMAVAQLVKAVTGFGSALVAMPILLFLLPPAEAILVMVVTDLFAGSWLVLDVWRRVRWPLVLAMLVGVVPGQYVGTELLQILDPIWVSRALGVLVAGMGGMFAIRPVVKGAGELTDLPEAPWGLLGLASLAGLCAGMMGGMVGAGGPPLVAYCKRFYEDQFYRAQLITLLLLSALALASMLIWKGARVSSVTAVPWMLLPVLVGNRLGAWLSPRVSREAFGRLTGIVLVVSGLGLLF